MADESEGSLAIALRAIKREVAEECAKIAERRGYEEGEATVGYYIAQSIREHFK